MLADGGDPSEATSIQNYVMQKCETEGVEATIHIGLEATVAVIMNFLRQKKIDVVLLSPSVTESRSMLNKLVKFSPRPVITMARGASLTQS
jgi:hypothetical protein